jgi:hypothetical protein
MTSIAGAALLVLIAGILLGIYAWRAPRRVAQTRESAELAPLHATTDWTNEAGEEFAGLSESARCDLIFAVGALDDERSQRLLEHALRDPAEAVSLAAAHALAGNGRRPTVDAFLASNPGERAERIAQALALLD